MSVLYQAYYFRMLQVGFFPSDTSESSLISLLPDQLVTGSWDSNISLHDPRSSNPQTASYLQPERVYFMDAVGNNLVVAMANRKISIFDLRNMEKPKHERESSLRFMTRALACMPSGEGATFRFIASSVY